MSGSQFTPPSPTQPVRVLFSGIDGFGHLFPLLPLARELRRSGHSVAFMAPPPARSMLAGEGFPLLPAGPSIEDVVAATASRQPELFKLPPERAIERGVPIVADIRVELTLPEALAAARAWRPDMIISEHSDFVGPLLGRSRARGGRRSDSGPGPNPTCWH